MKLETYELESGWRDYKTLIVTIEETSFASGAFRNAFKAISREKKIWIMKKYLHESTETIKDVLNISTEDHTRKQCQMHSVARNITQRLKKRAPVEFGSTFTYKPVYFIHKGEPVTMVEYIDGTFTKYVNNDGACMVANSKEMEVIYMKAQALVHFSYVLSEGNFMVTDIQGTYYNLYDPEIATLKHQDIDNEFYFCAGNLSTAAFEIFKEQHKCSCYCRFLELKEF